jgi:hypothetical protein
MYAGFLPSLCFVLAGDGWEDAGGQTVMSSKQSGGNPGSAGPKGALAEDEQRAMGNKRKPKSGPAGAEGNNTRRDFVQRKKKH